METPDKAASDWLAPVVCMASGFGCGRNMGLVGMGQTVAAPTRLFIGRALSSLSVSTRAALVLAISDRAALGG